MGRLQAADGRLARAEECGGWQEATASLLRKTRTEEKGKRKKKEGILQLEVGVPEREKARQSFSEELRYGHIGCFCFLISFISILFSLLLFLLCHCWSWMSIVEDWTLLSLSWLHLLCFCCYSLCFLSCLVFPEYEAVKGNESMGYYPADSPHPPWQRRSSNPPSVFIIISNFYPPPTPVFFFSRLSPSLLTCMQLELYVHGHLPLHLYFSLLLSNTEPTTCTIIQTAISVTTQPARYRRSVAAALSATRVASFSPRRPGLTEGAPHAPAKAAAAGSILGRGHQAAAAGSSHERRRRNATADAARMAIIEVAARKPGILDGFRGPPALAPLPSFPPSPSPEVRKKMT